MMCISLIATIALSLQCHAAPPDLDGRVINYVEKSGYKVDIRAVRAIVKAGELTAFGSYRTVVVRRKDSDGVVRTIKVMPDDLVEPGDEVRVKIDYFGS